MIEKAIGEVEQERKCATENTSKKTGNQVTDQSSLVLGFSLLFHSLLILQHVCFSSETAQEPCSNVQ